MYAEPMTSRFASVLVAEAPIKTWFVVVVRRIPDPLKVFHSCPTPPPAPASAPQVNFPVEALYSKVKDSLEQSPSPSWKKPRAIESCVVEAKSEMVRRVTDDDAVEVLVKEPTVSEPMFAAGPEEEPVRLPVTFPVRFPMNAPVMFPAVRLPPLRVRYVAESPWRDEVAETERLANVPVAEKVAPTPATLPEEVRLVTLAPWRVDVPEVAEMVPKVPTPAFTAGPEEEPVSVPVTLPTILPVSVPETMRLEVLAVPVTTRFVVVAVFETTRLVVEALVVAVKAPTVSDPVWKVTVFPVRWRDPAKVSGDS